MNVWDGLAAVVLDMDGVVFIGQSLRRGINELLVQLAQEGLDYHILTNTSASTSQEIAAKLANMGLQVEHEKITTSSELAADYIRGRCGADTAFTVGGSSGLASALQARGIKQLALEELSTYVVDRLAGEHSGATYPLVIGWTSKYDYELATKVLRLENCISDIYSTGIDRCFADETGNVAGIVWVSGSIAALLDKAPINLGKPNPYSLEHVLRELQQPPSETALIGDSLSDIEIGNEAGCRTILVLGGATPGSALKDLDGSRVPDLVITELTELL